MILDLFLSYWYFIALVTRWQYIRIYGQRYEETRGNFFNHRILLHRCSLKRLLYEPNESPHRRLQSSSYYRHLLCSRPSYSNSFLWRCLCEEKPSATRTTFSRPKDARAKQNWISTSPTRTTTNKWHQEQKKQKQAKQQKQAKNREKELGIDCGRIQIFGCFAFVRFLLVAAQNE